MTQEQKNLLLKDLCARLPYRVKVQYTYYKSLEPAPIWLLDLNAQSVRMFADEGYQRIEYIKPYLFPLSSMTEEQLYNNPIGFSQMLTIKADRDWENITINRRAYYKLVDWFNKNHFDYRGLIPMGLAIDATGLNIY